MLVSVYNQNCVRAGEICLNGANGDTAEYCQKDVPSLKKILRSKPKNSSEMFMYKKARNVIEFFEGEIRNIRV